MRWHPKRLVVSKLQAAAAIWHNPLAGSSTAWGMELSMHNSVTRPQLCRGAEHRNDVGPAAPVSFILEPVDRIGALPAAIGLLADYETPETGQMLCTAAVRRLKARRASRVR